MAQSVKSAISAIAGLTLQRVLRRVLSAIRADLIALYGNVRQPLTGSATWDVADLATGAQESKDVTVTGAALGDFAVASLSVDNVDLLVTANVTATNTATVTVANETGGNVNLASATVRVLVFPAAHATAQTTVSSINLTA